ncbi:inositol-tetrakisphosphate 1-kinase 3-like [Gossypium hirsutum]|uniref:Inositol-tetrakisphosphate 1-kinase 3-like n=1 Tax=Gossypium hirsutum TaxID=3635 RepID=A0ABM3BM26_GOSHI|nr:inositol-tetrakisphosphate 1-kinase 3-like [Gossypium hirsutum]
MSQCSIEVLPPQQQRNDVVVGYAFTSKKVKSFLRPKLQGLARNKGISFVPIDQSRSLSDQGPFDIVLHKTTGREWRQILEVGLGSRSYISISFWE